MSRYSLVSFLIRTEGRSGLLSSGHAVPTRAGSIASPPATNRHRFTDINSSRSVSPNPGYQGFDAVYRWVWILQGHHQFSFRDPSHLLSGTGSEPRGRAASDPPC